MNYIYIGTEEEKKEYFYKRLKNFEHSFKKISNKGLIFLKGYDNKDRQCKDAYHIIIRTKSFFEFDGLVK